MIIEDDRAFVTETTAQTFNNEVVDPTLNQHAFHQEILDGEQLTNDG